MGNDAGTWMDHAVLRETRELTAEEEAEAEQNYREETRISELPAPCDRAAHSVNGFCQNCTGGRL